MLRTWRQAAGRVYAVTSARGAQAAVQSVLRRLQSTGTSDRDAALQDVESNKKLLASYSPLEEFFSLFTDKGIAGLFGLQDKAKVINLHKDPFSGISVFVDLKNPLLSKYGFEPVDFLKGSREAFRQINMAVGSRELFDFSNGKIKTSKHADLLKQSVAPAIYEACLLACRQSSAGLAMTVLTECDVLDCELKRISVKILEEGDVDAPLPLSPPTASDSDSASESASPAGKLRRRPTSSVLASFPLGSVGVVVDVQFTSREEYKVVGMGMVEDAKTERLTTQRWTFVGELSGKAELDWVVTSLQLTPDA